MKQKTKPAPHSGLFEQYEDNDAGRAAAVIEGEKQACVVSEDGEIFVVSRSPHSDNVQRDRLDTYEIESEHEVSLRCVITGKPYSVTLDTRPTVREVNP